MCFIWSPVILITSCNVKLYNITSSVIIVTSHREEVSIWCSRNSKVELLSLLCHRPDHDIITLSISDDTPRCDRVGLVFPCWIVLASWCNLWHERGTEIIHIIDFKNLVKPLLCISRGISAHTLFMFKMAEFNCNFSSGTGEQISPKNHAKSLLRMWMWGQLRTNLTINFSVGKIILTWVNWCCQQNDTVVFLT